ncbi:acyl-CoA thioesterase [Persicobacter sp. CCB-QB2]|uniref:acyl-CoA thioesterase n=1 Tax=Persicobacter sp. CCB-QB2 TaxID=1561025 RepID=UPI0006A9463B|nr:acyl-CoA thioesterase [Persicobacter sp. CCB-QB2]
MNNQYKTVEDSRVEIKQLMLPSNANFSGKIHGGHILALMDQVAFTVASKHSACYCVTAAVERVEFLNPIEVGELVSMKAQVNYVGNTSMIVGIRVEAEDIKTGKTKHCNSSYFTMVAKEEGGQPHKVPGLVIKDRDGIRRFLRAAKQVEFTTNKRHEFHEHQDEDFQSEEYLEALKQYNVKMEL